MTSEKNKLNTLTKKLFNMLGMLIGTGLLTNFNQESIPKVQVSGLDDEIREGFEMLQHYGFRSFPPLESEVVFISPSGDRSEGYVIASSQRNNTIAKNINLAAGETLIYGPGSSTYIHLKSNKIIISTGLDVEIIGNVKIQGDLQVTGDILDNSSSNSSNVKNMRNVYNSHTHSNSGAGMPNQSM